MSTDRVISTEMLLELNGHAINDGNALDPSSAYISDVTLSKLNDIGAILQ